MNQVTEIPSRAASDFGDSIARVQLKPSDAPGPDARWECEGKFEERIN